MRVEPEEPTPPREGTRPQSAARPARPQTPTAHPGGLRGTSADALQLSRAAQDFARLLERLRALPEPRGASRHVASTADGMAIAAALLRDEAVATFLGFRSHR